MKINEWIGEINLHPSLKINNSDGNHILFNFEEYDCSAKVFAKPSLFGINNGRISKLFIYYKGNLIYNYDRGSDIHDVDLFPQVKLNTIINLFK